MDNNITKLNQGTHYAIFCHARKTKLAIVMQSLPCTENKIDNCYALMAPNSCKVHTISGFHDKHVKIQSINSCRFSTNSYFLRCPNYP